MSEQDKISKNPISGEEMLKRIKAKEIVSRIEQAQDGLKMYKSDGIVKLKTKYTFTESELHALLLAVQDEQISKAEDFFVEHWREIEDGKLRDFTHCPLAYNPKQETA